jgi:hypothetical protein
VTSGVHQTPAMKQFAEWFDAPPSSREHAFLRDEGWLGGEIVEVRYILGRLLGHNLFRESDDAVHRRLVKFIAEITSKEGAALVCEISDWQMLRSILRYRFETEIAGSKARKPREVFALETFLCHPEISLAELANQVGTTEKQLCRMTNLNYARSAPTRNRNRRKLETSRERKHLKTAKRRSSEP